MKIFRKPFSKEKLFSFITMPFMGSVLHIKLGVDLILFIVIQLEFITSLNPSPGKS